MIRVLKIASAAVVALALTSGTSEAVTPNAPAAGAAPTTVYTVTDHLAGQVAAGLTDRNILAHVAKTVASGPADLLALESGTGLESATRTANAGLLKAKGLPASSGSILRLRLANENARAALSHGQVPLVTGEYNDDEAAAPVAYDPAGGTVTLDAKKAPSRPVLVVEVDVAKALPLGVKVMNSALAAHGVAAPAVTATAAKKAMTAKPATATPDDGYWALRMDSIRLNDDEEPWIEGAAEIYAIDGGWGMDSKAAATIVTMPYLDYDGTTYYPNQILIGFLGYKYNEGDVVLMEDDGDTNYSALAIAITDAIMTIADVGTYIPLVNAILNAIPSSWWTNDPDYTDSFYTLSTTTSGTRTGAAGNATASFTPIWIPAL